MLLWCELATEHGQGAFMAAGISGGTAIPTKQDNPVAEVTALFRRQDLSQLLFYLFRVLALGQSQPSANADTVGIAYYTSGDTVQVPQQQIGGLSAYTRNPEQLIHSSGNFPVIVP